MTFIGGSDTGDTRELTLAELLTSFTRALARDLADQVLRALDQGGSLAVSPHGAVFTSRKLPPDCPSRVRFHAVVPNIPEAVKQGRIWIVPCAAWNEARRRKPRTSAAVRRAAPPSNDVSAVAERMLDQAGLRATRRGR